MNFGRNNELETMPEYMANEFRHLQTKIEPFQKKIKKYLLSSLVLIPASLFNIATILLGESALNAYVVPLIIFGLMGALGFALQKEAKVTVKELQETADQYIKSRIEKAQDLNEQIKQRYLDLITQNPMQAFTAFAEFLEEEKRFKENDSQI